MTSEGKTIAWIEQEPIGEYGLKMGAALIHFTDGTALEVIGASYEDVDLSFVDLSPTEVRASARRRMGYRERKRLERLKREEWLAISCEERAARNVRKASKGGTFADQVLKEIWIQSEQMRESMARQWFGDGKPYEVLVPCPRCHERECPNSRVEVREPPRRDPVGRYATFRHGGFTAQ